MEGIGTEIPFYVLRIMMRRMIRIMMKRILRVMMISWMRIKMRMKKWFDLEIDILQVLSRS